MNMISVEKVKEKVMCEIPAIFARMRDKHPLQMVFASAEIAMTGAGAEYRSPTRALYEKCREAAKPIIENWDARAIHDLISLAGYVFPDWVEQGRYTVELQDTGWFLVAS